MPRRVIALFFAFVLLWLGLASIEAPRGFALPSAEPQHVAAHADDHVAGREGQAEHPSPDELPLQPQSDQPLEWPEVHPVPVTASVRVLVTSRPGACASAQAGTPFLAGPLRPPCGAPLAG